MTGLSIQDIYEKHKKDVYQYMLSLTHNKSISEDITSEVFLSAIKSLHSFQGKSDIKTWLFSIARYKWYEQLRKSKKEILPEDLVENYLYDSSDPQVQITSNELIKRIHYFLDQEPEKNRDIVLMRIDGYSFYEISKKHSISESSARVLDFRTKRKIKELLIKEGYR